MEQFDIIFRPSGRGKAQCPSNPDYPDGIDLSLEPSPRPTCKVELPYPAAECGMWLVHCTRCGTDVACTAAGRPDDPRSMAIPCNRSLEN